MSLNVTSLHPTSPQTRRERPPVEAGPRSTASAPASECRALVTLAPAGKAEPSSAPAPSSMPSGTRRTDAAYLAHLIATAERLPQTRARCRAEPAAAAALYRDMTARVMGATSMDCIRVG